jgi:hypothetical protein
MEKYKKVLEKTEAYIQFSDEELAELGWKEGQKLSIDYDKETNSIFLKPYVNVEIDMSSWSREMLEHIISISCKEDISCNRVIEDALKDIIKNKVPLNSKKEQLICE